MKKSKPWQLLRKSHKKTTKKGTEKNKYNIFSSKCYFCEKLDHKKENCKKFELKSEKRYSEHSSDKDDKDNKISTKSAQSI